MGYDYIQLLAFLVDVGVIQSFRDTTAQLKVDLTEMEEKKKKVIFSLTKGNIDEKTLNQLCEIIDKSRFR